MAPLSLLPLPRAWRHAYWMLAALYGVLVLAGWGVWVWDDLRPDPAAVGASFAGIWLVLATAPWSLVGVGAVADALQSVPSWVTATALAVVGWSLNALLLRLVMAAAARVLRPAHVGSGARRRGAHARPSGTDRG